MKRQSARTKQPSPAAGSAGVTGVASRWRRTIFSYRVCGRSAGGLRCRRRAAQVPLPEPQQAAAAQDGRGQRLATLQQFLERDRLAAADALQQPEVGRGEQADVVGVLPVDALEALGDHQPDAGQPLGGGAVLARGALAVAAARHRHLEAGGLHRARPPPATAPPQCQAGVREAGQPLVVVRQDRHRRDLVGGDVVAAAVPPGRATRPRRPAGGARRTGSSQRKRMRGAGPRFRGRSSVMVRCRAGRGAPPAAGRPAAASGRRGSR